MPIDNFKQISNLLTFDSEDTFYHLQIIKRKKEHPDLGSNSHVVKTYYVTSPEYLNRNHDEIVTLCNSHFARACINLNRRSFEKIAFQTLRKITDVIMNKDYKAARKAYESVAGTYSNEPEKRWIIDVDEAGGTQSAGIIAGIIKVLPPVGDKVLALVPTLNGYHIISRPFDRSKFTLKYDVHKDNPTILYVP